MSYAAYGLGFIYLTALNPLPCLSLASSLDMSYAAYGLGFELSMPPLPRLPSMPGLVLTLCWRLPCAPAGGSWATWSAKRR